VSVEKYAKQSYQAESHRLFISIDSVFDLTSGILRWRLGSLLPFTDSETGDNWTAESPDSKLRKKELSAKADIRIPEGKTLDEIISEVKATVWNVDADCSIYITVFFLEKAPYTFYRFPAKEG
tara:strand:- start:304 stop:672 length:369 start_codon:yes stop_codon:yes gene_type:complete